MKKLALIIAVAGIISLGSCAKKETVCESTILGVKNTVTVYEDEIKSCVGDVCATTDIPSNTTQAEYVSSLENAGYECK